MTSLYDANAQWANRPDDERFTSLTQLQAHVHAQRDNSKALVLSTREFHAEPQGTGHTGLVVKTERGAAIPSHWSFGQLAALAGAPAGYLRTLPSEMAADCLNFGLMKRDVEDVGMLVRRSHADADPAPMRVDLAAATGPAYGRIWNSDIVDALVSRFGDGVSDDCAWRVPGEFGERVPVTKGNTTLYASDRDLWVFLADEEHRIELPGRRAGKFGTFARGVIIGNSEVGSKRFFVKTFLHDYTCCNRIIWGAEEVQEFTIRHTKSAPARFIELVQPALERYVNASSNGVVAAIDSARSVKLTGGLASVNAVEEFLAKRFTKSEVSGILSAHMREEDRPVETLWDAVVGATAYARSIPWQDERVVLETKAGELMKVA